MDEDSKFWVLIWLIGGATLSIVSLIFAGTTNESDKRSQMRAMACIEQGGTWIGVANACVPGKR